MAEDGKVNAQFGIYPSLRGRVVVVTGGASGIGERIVEQFAQQGATVAFLDIQEEAGTRLAAKIKAQGATEPLFLPCDLTDIGALQNRLHNSNLCPPTSTTGDKNCKPCPPAQQLP